MKIFSLDEAQSLLPVLESLLRRAIDAKAKATELETELQKFNQQIFFSGGMLVNNARIAEKREALRSAVQQANDALQEIESIGVQVKDLESGLLDFPHRLGEEIVLLCWKLGETRIGHWHTLEAGFRGRKRLDERFLTDSPEKPN